jgi:S1-C subfamily serine protease
MKKLFFTTVAVLMLFSQIRAQNLSDVLENSLSSVVTVAVYKSEVTRQILGFRGSSDVAFEKALDLSNVHGSGSGFVIEKNKKKYIITNAHVIEMASTDTGSIYVFSLNRNKYEVRVLGGDTFYDIAVLEFVDLPGKEITTLNMRLTDPRIGEQVFAIGNPLGEYPYTVSDGIISAKNRMRGGTTGKFGFLQTTATVIWGNSGGPLIDAKGNVVGINSQIAFANRNNMTLWQPQINFALESKLSNRLIDEIIQNNGRVIRAFLGIELSEHYELVSDGLTGRESSILLDELPVISNVLRASPSFGPLSGKIGWSLVEVNGVDIRNLEEALGEFEKLKPGESAVLTLMKDNNREKVQVRTQELNAQRHEQLARYMFETNDRIHLGMTHDVVSVTFSEPKESEKEETSDVSSDSYYILTLGIYDTNFQTLWRVNNLSDLGVALRFSGQYGFYDVFLLNTKTPELKPQPFRINLSNQEGIHKTCLWY